MIIMTVPALRIGTQNDTSVCMKSLVTTRDRLIKAATRLFAQHGYRSASVRAICDLARANPGAVSYYFGGKKQLYRIVLRKTATELGDALSQLPNTEDDPIGITRMALTRWMSSVSPDDVRLRLLFRDLAEGGEGTAEAVAPLLRQAYEALLETADSAGPATKRRIQASLVTSLAPVSLILGAWPVLARGFGLAPQDRTPLLEACFSHGPEGSPRP